MEFGAVHGDGRPLTGSSGQGLFRYQALSWVPDGERSVGKTGEVQGRGGLRPPLACGLHNFNFCFTFFLTRTQAESGCRVWGQPRGLGGFALKQVRTAGTPTWEQIPKACETHRKVCPGGRGEGAPPNPGPRAQCKG